MFLAHLFQKVTSYALIVANIWKLIQIWVGKF